MDINDNNFKIMSDYLANTLNPDVNVRRPGKFEKTQNFNNLQNFKFFFISQRSNS